MAEMPSERDAIERFAALLEQSSDNAAWTMDRLFGLIHRSSRESLTMILLAGAARVSSDYS